MLPIEEEVVIAMSPCLKRQIFGSFILFISCLLIAGITLCAPVGSGKQQVDLKVEQGIGAIAVAHRLKEARLISSAVFFRWFLTLGAYSIQQGEYVLNDGMWLSEIAAILGEGRIKLKAITIPEGWNHRQIGDYFASQGLIKDRESFLRLSRSPDILRKYRIQDTSTEGYLYPETYMIPPNYTAEKLHGLMLEKFFSVLRKITTQSEIVYTGKELRRRIILASIVEREARHAHERPVIAQVFLNRIKKNMKLESCATIQYLFPKPKVKLYHIDLVRPSPYNTYLHRGLPPGPIANSGKAALEAAFRPDKNDYLYFVVKPDGTHHFSVDYQGHIQAKKKYIDSDLVAR